MRKTLILTLAVIAMLACVSVNTNVAQARGPRVVRSNNGFFGQLMEMERRKNAWLRSTFMGR